MSEETARTDTAAEEGWTKTVDVQQVLWMLPDDKCNMEEENAAKCEWQDRETDGRCRNMQIAY